MYVGAGVKSFNVHWKMSQCLRGSEKYGLPADWPPKESQLQVFLSVAFEDIGCLQQGGGVDVDKKSSDDGLPQPSIHSLHCELDPIQGGATSPYLG